MMRPAGGQVPVAWRNQALGNGENASHSCDVLKGSRFNFWGRTEGRIVSRFPTKRVVILADPSFCPANFAGACVGVGSSAGVPQRFELCSSSSYSMDLPSLKIGRNSKGKQSSNFQPSIFRGYNKFRKTFQVEVEKIDYKLQTQELMILGMRTVHT